ncbi:hypothetical protein G7Y89_g9491 [Cudoniella acicularis]|uniref:Uncharacterized protein n=1 Tax=Cudoniella acicularis TaxID=354080 RepID=A0A8H4W1U6_9HELO|nr:hypothetical protein G7Y89_g9491 [Cudoniella acicularis]
MEGKKAKAAASKGAVDLGPVNKQIALLKERQLPHIPHLLLVNTDYPYRPEFPHENQNTPFESWEVKALQYMTLVADGDRGIALAKGNWEDEYTGPPPTRGDARSSTTTPNPHNKDPKKPSVKYSIKDYKNMKQTGVRPSPRPAVADIERRPGHSRNTSAMSLDTPMSRVSSMEGPTSDPRANGATASVNSARIERIPPREERSNTSSNRSDAREKPRSTTNGHIEHSSRDPVQNKGPNIKVQKSDPPRLTPHIKHSLPPRPPSPRREKPTSELKSQKRLLENTSGPPEKRTKVEPTRPRSDSQNAPPKKPEVRPEAKPSPTKSQKPQSQSSNPSPLPKKILSSKPADMKKKNSEKPIELPPLLSPLPADLENGPTSHPSGFATVKKGTSGKTSSSNTPSKGKTSTDTIVVKRPPVDSSPLSTPPQSSSTPPFILPRILSPGLPDIVEQELLRLQQKSAQLNTVESRHKEVRQPDAPGVARKMPKSKVGHPPKKTHAESSKSQEAEKSTPDERGDSRLIVKIPYKKSKQKDMVRLLATKPTPSKEFLRLEAERRTLQQPKVVVQASQSDSEEDRPLAELPKPPPPPSRKRPTDSSEPRPTEPRVLEPPPKRVKVTENVESSRTSTPTKPALKSPAHIGPSEKSLLTTPRKGDAMKTIAMRRVDSNDSHARTPQAATISTPASAEKPRINGELRVHPDLDRLRGEEKRLTAQATKLKHKMDEILKLKTDIREARNVTEAQRKLGLSYGLECIVVYMNAFSAKDRISQFQKQMPMSQSWESLLKLWEFLDTNARTFPILQALSSRLGALCREELQRIFSESKDFQNREQKCYDLLRSNFKERDKLWNRSHASRSLLAELGITDVLGPWTTVPEATSFAMDALGAYSKKEKVGWKRDPGF